MNKASEKIVFIGAGKVATALGLALSKKREIIQVYSQTTASAKTLAGKLKCTYTNDLKKVSPKGDIYIIAVKDDAIEGIAKGLKLKGKAVIHTSGSAGMDVLKKASADCGVMYPPHSFLKDEPLGKNVPFCLEASNTRVKKQMQALVKDLSGKAYFLNSAQRGTLHLAGVFANNFSNHMFVIANDIAHDAQIPFDILFHLIEDSVMRLKRRQPRLNQTGPALRGDKGTLKKHEAMLKNNPRYLALYRLISKSIQESAK